MKIFIAASLIAQRWKQPECPSVDEWIKMSYIHTIEYFSTTKRNEVLIHGTTWMSLEKTLF